MSEEQTLKSSGTYVLDYGSRHSSLRFAGALVCMILGFSLTAMGQSAGTFDTGTITGSVSDATGALIPNASVTITNTGTGNTTTVETGGAGSFNVPSLPFGRYLVSAIAGKFNRSTTKEFVLNVGATARVDIKLSVAAASEDIQVTGTNATIDTSNATSGSTLNEEQIRDLPTNGRDVTDFLEIASGSVNSIGPFQGSVNGQENFFTGLDITLDGQNSTRPDVNGFGETEGNEQSRLTRASVDSVQEIDFANSGYGADVGHSLGPQMNIVTKGGTNQFHGEIFDFFRNDALDSKDYFANSLTSPAVPLRMNQFGGNIGGPIKKNKLFFFVNYEAIRQRTTSINSLYSVPSAYVRSQFVAAMQPVLAQMAPLPANCASIPAPTSCANPNFPDANPAKGSDVIFDPAAFQTTLREDSGAVRIDFDPTSSDRLFARYSIDNGLTVQQFGLNEGQTSPLFDENQYLIVDETHTFSPTFVNEANASIQDFYSDTNSDTPKPFVGFEGFFTNLSSLPGPSTFNQVTPFKIFAVLDNATKTLGNHSIRFGTQIQVKRLNEFLRSSTEYEFGSFHDLENDAPFAVQKSGFPGFVGIRNSNWGFYGEDDWRANRKLTFNFGLRTDINTVWSERNHIQQNFDFATQAFSSPTQPMYSGPTYDVAPRLGLSYDPFGRGKTVIHAYYGLFYNPMHFGFGLVGNNPLYSTVNVNIFNAPFSLAYPLAAPLTAPPTGSQQVNEIPRNEHDPYSPNWLFGIQQEILPNTVLTVNYTGNEDHRQDAGIDFSAVDRNPGNYVTQARQYPLFSNEYLDADELQSSYHALQVQVRHNAGRLNVEGNYSWSHEIDDMVNVFNFGFSNPYDPRHDLGRGDWDIRQNLTGSVVYNFTELKGHSALMRTALGGWQTSSIVQTRTGAPINVVMEGQFLGLKTRPISVAGKPVRLPNFSWPSHSYDYSAFTIDPNFNGVPGDPSTLGNVGRNSLNGPGFFQWDFSGMKNFPLWETTKVQFRADLFNILNHPNFAGPGDSGICTGFTAATSTAPATCTPDTNFAKVSQTIGDETGTQVGTGTARQIQLSLKVIF